MIFILDIYISVPNTNRDLKCKVIAEICSDIGHKWKELARALKIKEGQIDDLEDRYHGQIERVREILLYHIQNCDSRTWRSELEEALRRARRTDLSRRIAKIIDISCNE